MLTSVSGGFYQPWDGVVTNTVTTTGTIMLSVLPLILGFQLLLQSVVMDIHENERYK